MKYMTFCGGINGDGASESKKMIINYTGLHFESHQNLLHHFSCF